MKINTTGVALLFFFSTTLSAAKANGAVEHVSLQKPKRKLKKPISLAHVISPFEVKDCDPQFCPFDQDVSVTISSMIRAQKRMTSGSVTLASAAFKGEDPDIAPKEFHRLAPLNRSTKTEYPHLVPQKDTTFIQDIFDSALESDIPFDYLIYTNADIILHEDFYNLVNDIIETNDYDFFTINRRTVDKSRGQGDLRRDLYSGQDLPEIFELDYEEHPGHDCFVMKKSIVQQLDLGDIYLGTLFFANVLKLQAEYYSTKSFYYKSHDLLATFHFGDDRNWDKPKNIAYMRQNSLNAICKLRVPWRQVCIETSDPVIAQDCFNLRAKVRKFIDPRFDFVANTEFCEERFLPIERPKRVRFVFALGVEGTGHRFLSDVNLASPLSTLLEETGLLGLQLSVSRVLHWVYNLQDFETYPESLDLRAAYEALVFMLSRLGTSVEKQIVPVLQGNETLTLQINLPDPNTSNITLPFQQGDSQLPDLGILYQLCDDANVECGHFIMTRDPHDLLQSRMSDPLVSNVRREILSIATQLNVQTAQLLKHSSKLVGCFDYSNPATNMDMWPLDNLLGWNVRDGSLFAEMMEQYSRGKSILLSEADRAQIVPQGFELHMDAMVRAMAELRSTCTDLLPAKELKALSPPYRIVQIGRPRSGSTFQYQLLKSIVMSRVDDPQGFQSGYLDHTDFEKNAIPKALQDAIDSNQSFVFKTHKDHNLLRTLHTAGTVVVFSSSNTTAPYALFTQQRSDLISCSVCEVDKYKEFFGLSEIEVEQLRSHVQAFGILRRCCGMQMSKYEVLRLNGCNVKAHSSKPDYPHCEIYNLTEVEKQFDTSPVPFNEDNPALLWAQPGDCQRFRDKVRSGRGFNYFPVTSCKINGPHGTVGDWGKAGQEPPKANSKTVPAKEVENEAVLKNLQDSGHMQAGAVNMAGANKESAVKGTTAVKAPGAGGVRGAGTEGVGRRRLHPKSEKPKSEKPKSEKSEKPKSEKSEKSKSEKVKSEKSKGGKMKSSKGESSDT